MISDRRAAAARRKLVERRGLHEFIRLHWHIVEPGTPFIDSWHLHGLCEHLEAVSEFRIKRLVVNLPPNFMKSLTCNVFWPAWHWLEKGPQHKWFHGSNEDSVMLRDAERFLNLLTCAEVKASWPEFHLPKRVQALGIIRGAQESWRVSSTPGGKAIGWHFNFQGIDDPIKPSRIRAGVAEPAVLAEAIDWLQRTLAMRLLEPNARVLIMQRLHEMDPAGVMLGRGWEHYCVPMRTDQVRVAFSDPTLRPSKDGSANDHGSSLGGAGHWDPRTEPGQIAWAERFNEEAVRTKESELQTEADVSAQLQQMPVPAGGNIVKDEYFRYWLELPDGWRQWQIVQSWDFGFKGDSADHSRLHAALWAFDGDRRYYLLDENDPRPMTFPAACQEFEDMQRRPVYRLGGTWGELASIQLIEAKANGPAIMQSLIDRYPGMTPVEPGDQSKLARMIPHLPAWIQGYVLVPNRELTPWVKDYQTEITKFPRGTADDRWDTTSQVLTYFADPSTGMVQAMRAASKSIAKVLENHSIWQL